ncbi:unnamed protein product [Dimorphilus gyrociliatus]|uniref:Uncharacterized protein n=1 Tax=Dimorphilus gyrociliatus TaxID=2664684 RepID=A0A7I8VD93_9ANNE|nr:unnamed protein product [Dimorphilus gyrociliatus]
MLFLNTQLHLLFFKIINLFDDLVEICFGVSMFHVSLETLPYFTKESGRELLKEGKENITLRGLKILLEDVNKFKEFSATGKYLLLRFIGENLNQRQRSIHLMEYLPEVQETNFKRPVFILSLPRTGSTFFHCSLLKDKRWNSPTSWEFHQPLPHVYPLPSEYVKKVRSFNKSLRSMEIRLGESFTRSHHVEATSPEDIGEILIGEGIWCYMAEAFNLPNYMDYIKNLPKKDFAQSYNIIKKRIRLMCRYQNMENRRFLLMLHLGLNTNIEALLETFPDAQFIMLHRNLTEIIPSATSLYSYLQLDYKKQNLDNKQFICDGITERYVEELEKMKSWRNSEKFQDCNFKRIIDIKFTDLIKDPIQVFKSLYKDLEMEYTPECNESFLKHFEEQNKIKRVKHVYQKVNVDKKLLERSKDYHHQYVY